MPSAPEQRDPNHVPALDGMRGLAVLLVIVHHLFWVNTNTPSRVVNSVTQLLHAGWVGVDLFFALSGFLITRILYVTLNDSGYLRKFYARRVLRIFPLYYGMLFVLLALTPFLPFDWHGYIPWYLTYTANLRASGPMPLVGTPSHYWPLPHFWSLQVEEQFYLVWPFLILLLRTRRRILIAAASLSVAAVMLRIFFTVHIPDIANNKWPYAFTPCRIDSLLFGAMLALTWFTNARRTITRAAPYVLFACIAILAADGIYRGELSTEGDRFLMTIGYSLPALAGTALIAMVLNGGRIEDLFLPRPLTWLGKYSYGLYIFHMPLANLLTVPLRTALFTHTRSHLLSVLVCAVLIFAVSCLLAWLSYNLYEKHFLYLKRYFRYDRNVVYQQPGI